MCFVSFLLFITSSFVLNTVNFRAVLSCVLPLIYHISNYIQFEPFIIFLLQRHHLPAGINKVSSNLNLMKLCQTQQGALVALFSADFKLSSVLRSCCFDITTDGLLLSIVSDVTFAFLKVIYLFLLHLYTSYFH